MDFDYNPYFDNIAFDKRELKSIINSLYKIGDRLLPSKTKQIIRKSVKPLRDEMKSLAPKNTNPPKYRYYGRRKDVIKYRAGTLKRSVAIFSGKKGIFVAPRIGRLNKRVLGKPNLDGYYAHFVIQQQSGGGFIEQARLSKRRQVLTNIESEARKIIKW